MPFTAFYLYSDPPTSAALSPTSSQRSISLVRPSISLSKNKRPSIGSILFSLTFTTTVFITAHVMLSELDDSVMFAKFWNVIAFLYVVNRIATQNYLDPLTYFMLYE
ncbi:MAG: hypothetical protein H6850_00210 [Alphaproteobacteria bacterium]|nr:MAG: hypothetical protein H6850_00210 [Alphaproteobacteria bacterium]